MKKYYYILLRFINSHDPILIGVSDDPVDFIHRFIQQNGYTTYGGLSPDVSYDTQKDCHLWVGTNYSNLDCKIVSNPVKATGFFWLDLKGDAKFSLIK
jgi:hypothetical protein